MTIKTRERTFIVLLILILGIAFAMRFKGIWLGYPLPVHPDEPKLVEAAQKIIDTGDLNPHFFNYPSLNIYLQAVVYQALRLAARALLGMSPKEIPVIWYYLAGRLFNVLLSTGTILVTYVIGKRLFSSSVGLAAAWFLTFSFLHIEHSFTITVDTTVAFWLSLVALMAVMIYEKGARWAYYLLGGMFLGFAIGSKYTAAIGIAPLLIAHYKQNRDGGPLFNWQFLGMLLVIPVAFLATTPYALLDYGAFLGAVLFESTHYSRGHPGAEASGNTSFLLYGKYLLMDGFGLFPTLFAVAGLIWMAWKDILKAALIAITPLLLLLMVGRYKVVFTRNIVAMTPFLAILSGFFVISAYDKIMGRLHEESPEWTTWAVNILLALALIGSIIPGAIKSIQYLRIITLPDTRWVSIEWIEQNIPAGSIIGREHYTPPLEDYTDKFQIIPLGYYAVARKPEAIEKLDYMIVSSDDYERFLQNPQKYPQESQAYLDFFATHELVHEFVPDMKTLAGPKLSIYRIDHSNH